MPDRVGPGEHEPTFLREIAIKAKANKCHRFQDLYRYLNVEYLIWCWPQLNRNAAAGVDGVTAAAYEKELKANIEALVERLKAKRYRAKLVRRRYIPKEGGKERPGIPALEDKLIQLACAKLLSAIWRVLQRDRFTCCACGASPALTPGVELHVDHTVAWSKGGLTVFENLQTLCSRCNLGKSNVAG